jgi:hypothetical protein
VTERALEPLFDLPVAEDTIPVDVPPSVEAEARLVVPHFQRYSSQERANLRSSHRLGPRQREAVGAHFFTHPDLPGLAFPTRVSAARAAVRAREKVPVGPVRMTSSQRWVLQGADQDGELQRVDGRIMPGLERRGWVVKTYRRQGRRTVTVWRLTLAGTAARDNAEVVEPAPRPEWLQTWTRERIGPNRYLVEGHELVKPGRDMLWRVRCPERTQDPEDPVAYVDTLAEAVDRLRHHLWHEQCRPTPVDLDAAE